MDYRNSYIQFLKTFLNVSRPLSIVFDASNGPAGKIAEEVFRDARNLSTYHINTDIDPDFKAHGPNPLATGAASQCQKMIIEHNADLGVIFDADGDRAVFLDNTGVVLDSYLVLCLLSKIVPGPYVVDEIVFNALLNLKIISESDLIPTKVGSYFIKEKMRTTEAQLGVELSGHYYFKDFFNSDSGIVAAIKAINAVSSFTTNIHDQIDLLKPSRLILDDIGLNSNTSWTSIELALTQEFGQKYKITNRDGITIRLNEEWINIRKSNTEPIIRMTAGGNEEKINSILSKIKDVVQRSL
jgi:phosphomannomutase